jgi:hypothetical protein
VNLIFRFIRFLVASAFKLAIRLGVAFVRFILLPFLQATLRVSGRLIFTSMVATVNGPTQFTDHLAADWTRRVLELGIPHENIDQIFALCRFLVGVSIVLGWVVSALFIVAILRVVFGLLF